MEWDLYGQSLGRFILWFCLLWACAMAMLDVAGVLPEVDPLTPCERAEAARGWESVPCE